jgi:RND family efflux transporter MFP subunit
MKPRSIGSLFLAALFLASALALAVTSSEQGQTSFTESVRRVRVAEVSSVTAARSVRFSGVTRAAKRADLAFSIGARLAARPAAVGQRVAAGTVLARLDDRELRHAVTAAEAGLADVEARRAQADSVRRRVERLFAASAATAEELEQVAAGAEALTAARDAAEARLGDARRLLGEAILTAPFAGVVTDVRHQPGEFVAPGHPVVMLSGSGALETEVRLPETVVVEIREGDRVRVELPLARIATAGSLERVGRAAGGGGLYPVLVALDPTEGLLPGMTAEVELDLATGQTLAVPLTAVLNPGGDRPRVFRLVGDTVEAVTVDILELLGDRVAVRAELAAGDEVVVTGHTSLVAGDRVEVLR